MSSFLTGLAQDPGFPTKNKQLIRNNFCGVPHSYDIRNDSEAYFEERREKLSFRKKSRKRAGAPFEEHTHSKLDFDEDRCMKSQRDPFATKQQTQRV